MWSPLSTPNGWWPRFSPDGLKLAFGNAESLVADFRTSPPQEIRLDMNRAWAGHWLTNDVLTFFHEQVYPDGRAPGWQRFEVRVPTAGGAWRPEPKELIGPHIPHGSHGHWGAFMPWGEVLYDGVPYDPARGGHGCKVAGDLLLQLAPEGANLRLHHVPSRTYRTIRPIAGANETTLTPDGWIGYGYSGPAYVAAPDGRQYDVTATPWRTESVPQVVMVGGVPWIWNATDDPATGQPFAIGRPLLDDGYDGVPVLVVPGIAGAALSVVHRLQTDEFMVAGCSANGRLTAERVPRLGPTQVLEPKCAPFPKKFYLGTFFSFAPEPGAPPPATHSYGSTPDYPQNCTVVVNPEVIALAAAHQPLIVPPVCFDAVQAAGVASRVIGIYIAPEKSAPVAQQHASEAKAQWRTRFQGPAPPTVWYITPGEPTRSDWLLPPDVDVYAPELYFDEYGIGQARMIELLWRMVANWFAVLTDGKPWMPICQAYDRARPQDVDMRAIATMQYLFLRQMVDLDRRIGTLPPAVGLLFFAVNRPGGAKQYPSIAKWHRAMVNSLPPGVPELTGSPDMALKKPEITVDTYRPIATPGGVFEFRDRENPDLDLRVTIRNDRGNIFAEISHRGGHAATGMPRPASGGDSPPPPPPPSRPGDVELPTYDSFLRHEGPEVDMAYRRPSLVDAGHTAWRRLNENWSHENILRDIRQQPTLELNQRQRRPEPTYDAWLNEEIPAIADAIRRHHQRDPSTGDIRHNAWRRFVEGWMFVNLIHDIKGEPLEEPPRPPTRTGLVRVEHHTFVDDGGPFLALGATFFWLAWGFRHDRNRLRENLKYLAERGVDYVRALGVVGPASWTDRTIDPNWTDYGDVIAGATDLAYDEFGLRVQWSLFGGVDTTPARSDRERVIDRFIEMSRGREKKIMAFEIANEGYQNGFRESEGASEAKALCRRLKAGVPHAVAVTAPRPDQQSASMYYEGAGAHFATYHLDRNTRDLGGMWRPARQAWEPQFFDGNPRAWTSNEPIGPQSSVAEDADPLRLTMSAVLAWVCGGAGYVLHCGAGIRGGGVEDLQRGRSSNFWETPNIDAILNGIRASRAALPPDVPNWPRVNVSPHASNFANYPFELQPLLDAQDQSPRRLLRAFCALGGSRFVIAPIQIQGDVHFVAKQRTEVELLHPLTGEIYRRETLNGPGDRLTVRPGHDPEGLILLGRR